MILFDQTEFIRLVQWALFLTTKTSGLLPVGSFCFVMNLLITAFWRTAGLKYWSNDDEARFMNLKEKNNEWLIWMNTKSIQLNVLIKQH